MRSTRSIDRRGAGGFTLIEVMIALAILAGGLVVLMRATASNIFAAQRAQMLTAASNLARAKMYDLEEQLVTDGFQELDKTEEGTFSDEGWPTIQWKVEIVKIELPDMSALQAMGQQGAEGAAGSGATTGAGAPAGGIMGGMMGGAEGGNAGQSGLFGAYYPLVADILKEGIRKVTLTVSYPVVGGDMESFTVTCYFTDPSAVNRKVPFLAGQEEEETPENPPPGGQ